MVGKKNFHLFSLQHLYGEAIVRLLSFSAATASFPVHLRRERDVVVEELPELHEEEGGDSAGNVSVGVEGGGDEARGGKVGAVRPSLPPAAEVLLFLQFCVSVQALDLALRADRAPGGGGAAEHPLP